MTLNKVCASGLKSIVFGAMGIQLGQSDVALVGGFENMSRIPYYMTDYRNGKRMGHGRVFDGLFYDGLTDYYNNKLMGVCAEKTAVDLNIGRKE